jgi:hypothetical protein
MLALGIAAVALTFLWLRTFRLQVSGGTLVYRTLFSGESRILLSDIVAGAITYSHLLIVAILFWTLTSSARPLPSRFDMDLLLFVFPGSCSSR